MREVNLKQYLQEEIKRRWFLQHTTPESYQIVDDIADFFYNLHQEHIKAIRAELEELRPETTMNESETCNPRCHASGSEDIIDQMLINRFLSLTEED